MSDDTDTHPFTTEPDLEEAIVKYSLGLLYKKGRGSMYERGRREIEEALAIVEDV